ncbi:mersacidin/lichenicidin family type 2 lantibiotic [Micromonospora mangrovi]|uniref:Mersacidin/lichenicidin family type 2 lantibiotic n=2 Tax=Micromonospora TaxID=1873 RepID=A0AAU8HJL8_9ACTN
MSNHIAQAWRDPHYLSSLSEADRQSVPPNPAGEMDSSLDDLFVGGQAYSIPTSPCTIGCPTGAICTPFYYSYLVRTYYLCLYC